MNVPKINSLSEFKVIIRRHPLVIIHCYSALCQICQLEEPITADLMETFPDAFFVQLSIERDPTLTATVNCPSVPGFVIYKNGQRKDSVTGLYVGPRELIRAVDSIP